MDAFSLVTITIYVKWTQRCVSGVGMGRYGYEGARPKLIVQFCNMLLYSILFVVNYLECTQNQLGLRKGMNFFLISHPYEARKFSLDNMSFCFRTYHVA